MSPWVAFQPCANSEPFGENSRLPMAGTAPRRSNSTSPHSVHERRSNPLPMARETPYPCASLWQDVNRMVRGTSSAVMSSRYAIACGEPDSKPQVTTGLVSHQSPGAPCVAPRFQGPSTVSNGLQTPITSPGDRRISCVESFSEAETPGPESHSGRALPQDSRALPQ